MSKRVISFFDTVDPIRPYALATALLISLIASTLYSTTVKAAAQCQTLYAGQTISAGTVCVDNSQDRLNVTYQTSNGWSLGEMHLFIGKSLAEMPQTKSGNPQIGLFPLDANANGGTTYTFSLPLGDYGVYNDTLVIAAHAVVTSIKADGSLRSETGWANGLRMVAKGNWATYFTYVIQAPPVVINSCRSTETAFAFGDLTLQELGTRINRWGWQISVDAIHGMSGQKPLYAGAAQNDPSRGKNVGTFGYVYANGVLDITYSLYTGYSLQETHVYAGNSYVSTGAPGQFGNTHGGLSYGTSIDHFRILVSDPGNDGIFIVGHATVCIQ